MEGCYANRHIAEHPEHNYPFSRIGIIRYQDDGENSSYISHYRKALACDQGSMKNSRYLRILLSFLLGWRDRCGSAYRIPMEACCMKKVILLLFAALIVYATFFSEKARLDREVNHLCAIDGGVRVYEKITLPADKFDQRYGQINFYDPTQGENALGPEYFYKWDIHYYKKGHPVSQGAQEIAMRRDHIMILRKSDMKLLGEVVKYHRAGGDLPGPWMPSSHHCPSVLEANEGVLMSQIFIPVSGREGNEE